MLSVATAARPASLDSDVLACVSDRPSANTPDPRWVDHRLPFLGTPGAELWKGSPPVRSETAGGISCAWNESHLFGRLELEETGLDRCAEVAERAYMEIATLLRKHDFPWLLRSWNYIHDIHHGAGDQERYKQFCLGRYRAVAGTADFERSLPAATVIGTRRPGLLVCFLAGKAPGVQVENPRQTSAFRYPREYGPVSPSFSRATLLPDQGLLLMSGTASVVGHATRHPHDVAAQCEEVFVNIRALLQQATQVNGSNWSPQLLRVFLRNAGDLREIERRVQAEFGVAAPAIYLEGDICRTDLMMEIDGVFRGSGPARRP